MNIDPMAEKFYSESPYVYAANNPVVFVDPDGMAYDVFGNEEGGGDIGALKKSSAVQKSDNGGGGDDNDDGGRSWLGQAWDYVFGGKKKSSISSGPIESGEGLTSDGMMYGGDGSGSASDWTYWLNYQTEQYNPIAYVMDAIYGYSSGADRYGNELNATQSTAKIGWAVASVYGGGAYSNGSKVAWKSVFSRAGTTAVAEMEAELVYTKSTLAMGREMHAGYRADQVIEGVAMKEFRGVPGVRPDFVNFATKTIYELKPYNPRAMRQGMKQLSKYQNAFQKHYGGDWKTILDTY